MHLTLIEIVLLVIVVELAIVCICLRRLISITGHRHVSPLRFVLVYDPANWLLDKLTSRSRQRRNARSKAKAQQRFDEKSVLSDRAARLREQLSATREVPSFSAIDVELDLIDD